MTPIQQLRHIQRMLKGMGADPVSELIREAADALERQSAAPAQGTVRVRIACGVKPNGSWYAAGADNMPDPMSVAAVMAGSQGRTHWITADLPLPAAQEIAGRVEGA